MLRFSSGDPKGGVLKPKPRRKIDWRNSLSSDRDVCGGALCAKGTRVLVTNILDSLAEGSSRKEILQSYPSLQPKHIDAAIAYAAELAREESLLPLVS